MRGRWAALLAAAALLCSLAAACGSSSGGGSSASGKSYTIGLLTDETGLASSADKSSVQGVQAGIHLASGEGYNLKLVVADTQSSPAQALTAAQKLVEVDHVLVVVSTSALTFAAASYLHAHGVPVVGSAQDGPEWLTDANMFSVFGRSDATKVSTTVGQFLKMEGVTTVGSLGYGIAALSAEAAKAYALSANAVGLKTGYLNANFEFGSTNVQPAALAMKNAGVNGVTVTTEPSTGLALIGALRQVGASVKAALLPNGYGGDLLQGGQGAVQAAQGIYFDLTYEPVEMHTPATIRFQGALKAAGVTTEPTEEQYYGYAAVDMIVRGLRVAGAAPSQAKMIGALSGIRDFDAAGLLGNHKVALGPKDIYVDGPDNCAYMTKLVGNGFQLVPGADPICGSDVPGVSVSSS